VLTFTFVVCFLNINIRIDPPVEDNQEFKLDITPDLYKNEFLLIHIVYLKHMVLKYKPINSCF